MSVSRRVASVILTAACAAVIAALSAVSLGYPAGGDALVRLSWRLLGAVVEQCRTLTEEELAALPAHMRRAEECSARSLDYLLSVEIDGRRAARDTVAPSGARRDRPLYVLRDLPVPVGAHEVAVTFEALVSPEEDGVESGGRPLRFDWRGRIELGPDEIALVTLDEEAAELEVRTAADARRLSPASRR